MRKFSGLAQIFIFSTLVSICPAHAKTVAKYADLYECMKPTIYEQSIKTRKPSHNEKLAFALMKMGKLNESIYWFKKTRAEDYSGLWKDSGFYIDLALGQVYEKLGKYKEALDYYAKSEMHHNAQPRAALYIKQNRFSDALELCKLGIDKSSDSWDQSDLSKYNPDYADWLRLSAATRAGLHENKEAVADYKKAALLYAEDDSDKMNECIYAANEIIAKMPQEIKLVIQPRDLPRKGQNVIFELLDFLISSSNPPDLATINKLLGAKLRMPDKCSELLVSPALFQVEMVPPYEKNPGVALLRVRVRRKNCAIDKNSIIKFLPASSRKTGPVYGYFSGEKLEDAESWSLASGTLILYFAKSGFQVLKQIEWYPNTAKMTTYGDFFPGLEFEIERAIKMDNSALAYGLAEKALNLPDSKKDFESKDLILSRIYENRAKLYLKDGKIELAMADLKCLSQLKAFRNFSEIIHLFIENGKIKEAIEMSEYALSLSGPKREKTLLNLLLARLYLQNKQYAEAVKFATECIKAESEPNSGMEKHSENVYFYFEKYEPMIAPAHLIRAKAQFALGHKSDAYRDGETASNLFFDLAHVECSFKIKDWIESIK